MVDVALLSCATRRLVHISTRYGAGTLKLSKDPTSRQYRCKKERGDLYAGLYPGDTEN